MKILMICLGNICRSPMAEGILRHESERRGMDLTIDSCGTNGFHNGEQADPRARTTMAQKGIDISDLTSRQIQSSDFNEFDLLFVMDSSNYRTVTQMATSNSDRDKVKLFLNEAFPEENKNVPDPYYGGDEGFENVYQLLNQATSAFLDRIK